MAERYDVALRGHDGVLGVGGYAHLDALPAPGAEITLEDGLPVVVEDVTRAAMVSRFSPSAMRSRLRNNRVVSVQGGA